MKRDPGSRRVLCVALAVAILWGVWCLLYETTGFPGLNYLAFGFVSLPVGLALFIAGLLSYSRARAERRATGDAVAAMFISVAIVIVPLVALVEFADYS
jgi:ABC-type transport system involved in cytochrome c biogenesis permease subunit